MSQKVHILFFWIIQSKSADLRILKKFDMFMKLPITPLKCHYITLWNPKKVIFNNKSSWTFAAANGQVLRAWNWFYFFTTRNSPLASLIPTNLQYYLVHDFDRYIQNNKMWIFETRCIIIFDKKLSYRSPIRIGTAWRTMWVEILTTAAQLYEKSYLK